MPFPRGWRQTAAAAAATFVLAPAGAQVSASTPPMDSLCPPGALVDAAFRREWTEAVVFDYDGDIAAQEKALSERLGVQLDLVNHWKVAA